MEQSRATTLQSLVDTPLDLLIIGAGITGAGIARDAAMRGFRTAIIDKADFGAGTSSHSSRLIHGGVRYLEQYAFHLVFESSRERRILLKIAPHLVRPLEFLFPVYRGGRVPAWQIRAGMWLYDLLSAFRNVRRHRWLGPKKVRSVEPGLRDRGLSGAALYYDAQVDDARLVVANIRAAQRAGGGAVAANYVEATALLKPDGRIRGAAVRDVLTGQTGTIQASVVVNATGPWSDALRRLDDRSAKPMLRPTKGAHVAVPRRRVANEHAVTLFSPIDGRVMFVLPWRELAYVGTTDTDADSSPDALRVTSDDVTYLLRSANAAFPNAHLTTSDVVSAWAGLRPLLRQDAGTPSQVSREHMIQESPQGLLSIVGGKLTTYRVMARDVVDRVAKRLHELDGRAVAPRAPTDREALPGGESADLEVLVEAARARGASEATARHLVGSYGSEAAAVLNLVDRDRALGGPIVAKRPEIWAEVVYAVEREMAQRVQDVLIRRLPLYYELRDQGLSIAGAVAGRMKKLLGWDETREAEELRDYTQIVERGRITAP